MTDSAPILEEISAIAEDAYVYAFPMLMGYRYAFGAFIVPTSPGYRGPLNTFTGEPITLGPSFRDVITPNADTPYSLATVDLRAEPIVLEVPAVRDRYYVMQIEDLFGQNAHYVGSRATGQEAGRYALAGPAWSGEVPSQVDRVLPLETNLAFVIGRTQLLGPDDDRLGDVMSGYRLTPLSALTGAGAPSPAALVDWPAWDDAASRDERFIGYLNVLLDWCRPPPQSEQELLERFSRIGIGPRRPFEAEALGAESRDAIRSGVESARSKIADRAKHLGRTVNGWTASDAFGDRVFFGGDYLLRAAGAMAGWGGNDRAEASYPLTRIDSKEQQLDGSRRYTLRFATPPPAKAFWSVTLYDTSYDGVAGYLVDNPIDRYLINSTTQGLVLGDDGSLTIHIQNTRPDDAVAAANWLPAPTGPFYLALRIYWPEPAALDGPWEPPPVVPEPK